MEKIPHEVDVAVRAAARTATAYPGELADVRRRARRHRTRRMAAGSASVAAGVAAIAVAAAVVLRPEAPPPAATAAATVAPTATTAPAGPPQRLLLTNAAGSYRSGKAVVRLEGGEYVGEVRPDGRLTRHRVTGADNWDRAVGLPDGGIVALGPTDTMPGVERPDGAGVPGLQVYLVETGSDTMAAREMRQPVAMLTATTTTAYLWRPAGLVAYDLAAGAESVLTPLNALGVPAVLDGSIEAADLAGGRLVLARASAPCIPRVLDTGPDTVVADLRLAGLDCRWVTGLRLSPGADTVAVTYQRTEVSAGIRVALVRISDGAVLADQAIAGTARAAAAKDQQVSVDTAWVDNRTLRGVAVPIGPGTHDLTPFTMAAG